MPLYPRTNQGWLTFPHEVLTLDVDWEPACLDPLGNVENEIWHGTQSSVPRGPSDATINECGEFREIRLESFAGLKFLTIR